MSAPRVLVAGLGNVFLGDDGFGVEVAQQLLRRRLPHGVRVSDVGIRGYDLAFAMLDGPQTVVIVDATPRGGAPGTLYLIDVGRGASATAPSPAETAGQASFDGHAMTPQVVLELVRRMGGCEARVLVLGCEPEPLGDDLEGRLGLSQAVAAAVPAAVERVELLVDEHLSEADGATEPAAAAVDSRQEAGIAASAPPQG